MVKGLDDKELETVEHIGVALHRAAEAWRSGFRTEMAARGFPWHLGASGEVLAHLGPSGLSQAVLTDRMGLSKQAGAAITRPTGGGGSSSSAQPDPADKRAKQVMLTELGLRDFAERNRVKKMIETQYRDKLGSKLFVKLQRALRELRGFGLAPGARRFADDQIGVDLGDLGSGRRSPAEISRISRSTAMRVTTSTA